MSEETFKTELENCTQQVRDAFLRMQHLREKADETPALRELENYQALKWGLDYLSQALTQLEMQSNF